MSLLRLLAVLLGSAALAACGSTPPPRPVSEPVSRVEPVRLRPEYRLAPTFAENRGRLPWPAEGTVTGYFGDRRDPASGTTTQAVGLDVATAPGAEVVAVFDGTVERVGTMATFGTFVMVAHGGWTSVYGNLSATDVDRGDRVRVGDRLGASGTRDDRRGAALFFGLFQGPDAVDPLPWLAPR